MAVSPIVNNLNSFERKYKRLEKEMIALYKKKINQGFTAKQATAKVLKELDFDGKIESLVLSTVVNEVVDTVGEVTEDFPEWYIGKAWASDGVHLSQTVVESSERVRRQVTKAMQETIEAGNSWTKVARDLTNVKTG